jgi:hypothetical protein
MIQSYHAKVWNKLPDQFIHAVSTSAFKNRLDKYCESEEIYYSNHRAEISGGNRSDIQLPDIDIILYYRSLIDLGF